MENKINWKNHFVELLIVTSGILIAFGLNSWREGQKEEKLAKLYMEGVIEELEVNRKELTERMEYHRGLLKELIEKPLEVRLVLKQPNVRNSAWKLAENDVFKQYVDPEMYRQLIQIYQTHERLNNHSDEMSRLMGELNVIGPLYLSGSAGRVISDEERDEFKKQVRQGWIPMFEDWIYYESQYIQTIDEVLGDKRDPSGK